MREEHGRKKSESNRERNDEGIKMRARGSVYFCEAHSSGRKTFSPSPLLRFQWSVENIFGLTTILRHAKQTKYRKVFFEKYFTLKQTGP